MVDHLPSPLPSTISSPLSSPDVPDSVFFKYPSSDDHSGENILNGRTLAEVIADIKGADRCKCEILYGLSGVRIKFYPPDQPIPPNDWYIYSYSDGCPESEDDSDDYSSDESDEDGKDEDKEE